MTGSVQAAAQAAAQIPGYCTSGHGILTPAQWTACWKAGWSQPTTGAAQAGAAVGHYAAPALVILAIILLVVVVAGRRSPAAQRS